MPVEWAAPEDEQRHATGRLMLGGVLLGGATGSAAALRAAVKAHLDGLDPLLAIPPGGGLAWVPGAGAIVAATVVIARNPELRRELFEATFREALLDEAVRAHARTLLIAAASGFVLAPIVAAVLMFLG